MRDLWPHMYIAMLYSGTTHPHQLPVGFASDAANKMENQLFIHDVTILGVLHGTSNSALTTGGTVEENKKIHVKRWPATPVPRRIPIRRGNRGRIQNSDLRFWDVVFFLKRKLPHSNIPRSDSHPAVQKRSDSKLGFAIFGCRIFRHEAICFFFGTHEGNRFFFDFVD